MTVFVLSMTVAGIANAGQATHVALNDSDEYGQYLVDGSGNSLYLFEADHDRKSTCHDSCAGKWPPLTASGHVVAGAGVEANKLSTIERRNGDRQVTYNGHPLYRYIKDEQPGQTQGQDIEDSGAEWYLLDAEGGKMGHGEHE